MIKDQHRGMSINPKFPCLTEGTVENPLVTSGGIASKQAYILPIVVSICMMRKCVRYLVTILLLVTFWIPTLARSFSETQHQLFHPRLLALYARNICIFSLFISIKRTKNNFKEREQPLFSFTIV